MASSTPLSKLPFWLRLTGTVLVLLSVFMVVMIAWESRLNRQNAIDQASEFADSIHEMTLAGLTGMMITGTIGQREVFLDQIKELAVIRKLEVVRGDAVIQQFGDGGRATVAPDDMERDVLKSGKERREVVSDARLGSTLRIIKPIIAAKSYLGKDCTTCHVVPEGTPLGVVNMQISLDKVETAARNFLWQSIGVGVLVSLPLLALLAFFIRRYLNGVLGGEPDYAVAMTRRIADGDLAARIDTDARNTGSLLNALQDMSTRLARTLSEVNQVSNQLTDASQKVSQTSQSLFRSANDQASTLQQTTESIAQMTQSIDGNSQNAKNTDTIAHQAARQAQEGGVAVRETVAAMQQIADKIGIVDDIAYQTNLLALNAAIEAARAGEHGKGFAVVAAEVRKLAERSQTASQEIGQVAAASVQLAEKAGKLLDDMLPSIKKTSDLVQEIATASQAQTSGVAQINTAMGQLNQSSQLNTSASQVLAETSDHMGRQVDTLHELMTGFTIPPAQS
jgi:methyl-accepting chemotaxis protein